ncbi:PREDICTED: probable phospholipid-transporting ATPase IIB, partial [Leptosomus discolor]|uniref:probable phospholipid-transporting ATPase IIB n=1 Tax=Leptosomus discolor TaxID=188344 RepID=UPI00052241A9
MEGKQEAWWKSEVAKESNSRQPSFTHQQKTWVFRVSRTCCRQRMLVFGLTGLGCEVLRVLSWYRQIRYQVEDESSHLDEMPLMMSEEGFENDESDYHTLPRARISQRRRGLEWFICGGWKFLCTSCSDWLINICRRKKELKARTVWLGCPEKCEEKYPKNAIKNQKYNIFTFIPGVLYEQFKFFLNLYFLVVSCSQFVPALKIGYLYTYWAPL